MTEKEQYITTTILITKAQKEYLDSREDINVSGFVRRKIDEAIALEGK